jgi:hypothetical protein
MGTDYLYNNFWKEERKKKRKGKKDIEINFFLQVLQLLIGEMPQFLYFCFFQVKAPQ